MNLDQILREFDLEIGRLQQARAILVGTETTITRKRGRPAGTTSAKKVSMTPAVRGLSDEARAKMAAGQKARWDKVKQAKRIAAPSIAAKPAASKRAAKAERKTPSAAKTSVPRSGTKAAAVRSVNTKPTAKKTSAQPAVSQQPPSS